MYECGMCVGFTKMQNFDPFDDKNFQFPFFGRNSMGNQQINSNKSGKRRFYTGKMNQYQNILLLSSPINLRHEFYACVCVQKFPTTERNVARNFLLHVFYHSHQIWHRLSTRWWWCAVVNRLTSYGQTIHLDFCFVDQHFSYFFFVLYSLARSTTWKYNAQKSSAVQKTEHNRNDVGRLVCILLRILLKCSKWKLNLKSGFEQNGSTFIDRNSRPDSLST